MKYSHTNLTHDQLAQLAAQISALLPPVACVLLVGDLGAGKTTFARALIQSVAGGAEDVVSPTFTLVQEYRVVLSAGQSAQLFHYDLYRLKSASELDNIGIGEALESAICLIEWPDIATSLLPEDRLEIRIDFTATDDTRNLTLIPHGRWAAILQASE